MNKLRILISFRHFPVAIGRYFDWALRDMGHEVFSVGCYDGPRIPWGQQYSFTKYDFPPDMQIPELEVYPIQGVIKKMPWKPDLVIQAGDTTWLSGDPGCPNVIVATDPHCIDYTPRLANATHFACMQNNYMQKYDFKNKFWLPYAYAEGIHRKLDLPNKYDVVFIGLQYAHREAVLDQLKALGLKVFDQLGYLYEEYNEIYNEGKIAFNYSSLQDLPARFWEGLAMGRCLVTNIVPDLELLPFKENIDYVGFKDVFEAVSKITNLLKDPDQMSLIAESGYANVTTGKNTYKDRCEQLLKEVFK